MANGEWHVWRRREGERARGSVLSGMTHILSQDWSLTVCYDWEAVPIKAGHSLKASVLGIKN
jgi:hypothetical protein